MSTSSMEPGSGSLGPRPRTRIQDPALRHLEQMQQQAARRMQEAIRGDDGERWERAYSEFRWARAEADQHNLAQQQQRMRHFHRMQELLRNGGMEGLHQARSEYERARAEADQSQLGQVLHHLEEIQQRAARRMQELVRLNDTKGWDQAYSEYTAARAEADRLHLVQQQLEIHRFERIQESLRSGVETSQQAEQRQPPRGQDPRGRQMDTPPEIGGRRGPLGTRAQALSQLQEIQHQAFLRMMGDPWDRHSRARDQAPWEFEWARAEVQRLSQAQPQGSGDRSWERRWGRWVIQVQTRRGRSPRPGSRSATTRSAPDRSQEL